MPQNNLPLLPCCWYYTSQSCQGTEISVHRNANSAINFAEKHEMFSKLVCSSGEAKCTGPDVPSDQGQSVL